MLWLVALWMAACGAVLLYGHWRNKKTQDAIARRLQQGDETEAELMLGGRWMRQAADSRLTQRLTRLDGETAQLLNLLGWRRSQQHAMYIATQWLLPLLLVIVVMALQVTFNLQPERPLLLPIFALAIGYLLPKRLLVIAAARHQKQLAKDVSVFLPLLRILFDAGLTVEQALRVLSEQGQKLMPVLCAELTSVLRRVDSGVELADELKQSARNMAVDEFSDCLVILVQLLQQGGGAMNSLLALKKQMDGRRLASLQEYISKLSGKMSVVMMVFLFPALLIVLAGPGLSAIGRALGSNG